LVVIDEFLTEFQRYFINKQKPHTDGAKNRTFCSSLHAAKMLFTIQSQQNVTQKKQGIYYTYLLEVS